MRGGCAPSRYALPFYGVLTIETKIIKKQASIMRNGRIIIKPGSLLYLNVDGYRYSPPFTT